MFTEKEIHYLQSQHLARIATVSDDNQVDVTPVGFRLIKGQFHISGKDNRRTLKYKNVIAGNYKVALVIDDLETVDPWKPRGIKIHGVAEAVEAESTYLIITPIRHWSWGIETDPYQIKKTVWNDSNKINAVDEASKQSFPASDPPAWW